MNEFKPRKISLLIQYLLSYTSIVLITCSLICISIIGTTIAQMNAQIRQTQINVLTLALEDIQAQVETMEDITHHIAVSAYYQPSYLQRNPYYELSMVQNLAGFTNRSPLTEKFFLLYSQREGVFLPNAKNSESIYFDKHLNIEDGSQFAEYIRSLTELSIFTDTDHKRMFICIPARLAGVSSETERVILTFIVEDAAWRERLKVSGISNPYLCTLYYNGSLLMGNPNRDDESLCVGDAQKGFSVSMGMDSSIYITGLNWTKLLSPSVCLFLLIALAAGCLFAFRQYRPIRYTINRYAIPKNTNNELLNLWQSFDYYIQLNQSNLEKIDLQLLLLRRNAVLSLVCGEYSSEIDSIVSATNICLDRTYLCALALCTHIDPTRILDMIESLSFPSSVNLYGGIPYCDGTVPVLLCCTNQSERTELAKQLSASILEIDPTLRIGVGQAYQTVEELSISFQEAVTALKADNSETIALFECQILGKGTFFDNNAYLEQITSSLHTGDIEAVEHALTVFFAQASELRNPLLQRHMYVCLLNRMILIAHEMHLSINSGLLNELLSSEQIDSFERQAYELIRRLCEGVKNLSERLQANNPEEIVWYVDSHCLEYDISLDIVADHFDMSRSRLSRIFKQQTGVAFKEYIVERRITAAKSLLLHSEYSVADICQRIGYTNVSHFIKIFKNAVGETPASYRKKHADFAG